MTRRWGRTAIAAVGDFAWVGAMAAGAFALALGGERMLGLALG